MTPINMPQVGQDLPAARIVEWAKREGEAVQKGEVLATVESDKATFEVLAEQDGTLLKIVVLAGAEGEVFKPIAWLGQPGEECSPNSPGTNQGSATSALAPTAASEKKTESVGPRRPFSSPSARRVAREQGVDLGEVQGTGPGGRIVNADVLAMVATRQVAQPPQPAMAADDHVPSPGGAAAEPISNEIIPFSRMRQRIAGRLTFSWQTIPHFHLFQDVDMTAAQQWRQTVNQTGAHHLTVTDLIIYAVARALAAFRQLNAHVDQDRLLVQSAVNVGVATAVQDGLLVPVIPNADKLDLRAIARLSKQNAAAARRGVVDPKVQGTFTVSSLGPWGIPAFLPILNPPECGILAVGAIQPRVVPRGDGVGVRPMMTLCLACDHRAVDGAYAARFLGRLKELLETTWPPSPIHERIAK